MRAGLLSNPKVIETLNANFINSWIILDDIDDRLGHSDLAKTLHDQHEYPFDFIFLDQEGDVVLRLTSFKDLPGAHPAVSHPARNRREKHIDVFMAALAENFGT